MSWSFWAAFAISKEEKTLGSQSSGLEVSQVPRPGAACGNERHIQGLTKVKAPLTAKAPSEDAPTAPPDVGSQGAGWGGAAGGGGGIAAGFEREPPDRWGCPTFHEWLPLICFLHPPPAPSLQLGAPHCQAGGGRALWGHGLRVRVQWGPSGVPRLWQGCWEPTIPRPGSQHPPVS